MVSIDFVHESARWDRLLNPAQHSATPLLLNLLIGLFYVFAYIRSRAYVAYVNTKRYHVRVEEIHSVGTINNVETSYFTQLKMCYLMTTFRCPSDILITS